MPRFLFLMLGPPEQPGASDAQTQAFDSKWGQYMGSLAGRGALESGAPLEPTAKRVPRTEVTDQALARSDLYGYMVVDASSLDDAIAIGREAHTSRGAERRSFDHACPSAR